MKPKDVKFIIISILGFAFLVSAQLFFTICAGMSVPVLSIVWTILYFIYFKIFFDCWKK